MIGRPKFTLEPLQEVEDQVPAQENEIPIIEPGQKRSFTLEPIEEMPTAQPTRIEKLKTVGKELIEQPSLGFQEVFHSPFILKALGLKPEEFKTEIKRIEEQQPKTLTGKAARIAGAFAPVSPFGPASLATKKLTETAFNEIIGKVARKGGASKFVTNLSKAKGKMSESAKKTLADFFQFTAQVDEDATLRLIERGKKAWKPQYLTKNQISKINREKAQSGLREAFDTVGKRFESSIKPILEKSKEKLDISGVKNKFLNEMIDNDIIKMSTTKTGKMNLIPGLADTEGKLAKPIKNILFVFDDAERNPTLKNLHLLRKRIDNIKFGSPLKDNFGASNIVTKTRKEIVDKFPEEYKKINSKFKELFDVRDEFNLGGKLSKAQVENTLLGLKGKGKTELNLAFEKIDDLLPAHKKFYDNVLDEIAVKQFERKEPGLFRGAAISYFAQQLLGPAGLPAGIALTSPRVVGHGILSAKAAKKGISDILSRLPSVTAPVIGRGALVSGAELSE